MARVRRGVTQWSTGVRYTLFQIPGLLLLGSLLWLLVGIEMISARAALIVWGVWALKDAALYPFLRSAYAPDRDDPGEALRGRVGVARDPIGPGDAEGYVAMGPELWRAVLADPSDAVPEGEAVRVLDVDGMRLVVERDEADGGSPS